MKILTWDNDSLLKENKKLKKAYNKLNTTYKKIKNDWDCNDYIITSLKKEKFDILC